MAESDSQLIARWFDLLDSRLSLQPATLEAADPLPIASALDGVEGALKREAQHRGSLWSVIGALLALLVGLLALF